MASTVKARSLFDAAIVRQAIVDSFRKLTPRRQVRNPVMFVVYVGSILTTLLWVQALVGRGEERLDPQERRQDRSEEHTSELQSRLHLVCRLLLEKKKNYNGELCIHES